MRNIFLVISIALLGGCATFVETNVSAFHELERPLVGATYALVPTKEQEDNLEFKTYAKDVKSQLAKLGFLEAPFDRAKYAIFMFYGIDDGKQVISTYPIFGQTGSSNSFTTGTVTSYGNTASYSGTTYRTPTYGVVGSGTSSVTVFRRYLNIDIIDIQKSGDGKVQKVYEGKAVSEGGSAQLAPVMPAMVRSVFEDFPGKSGVSRTSRQPFEK